MKHRLPPFAPLLLVPIAIAAFSLRFHEPWRDEAGAALLATSVPLDLWLAAMRAEGVPFLFHALLAMAARVVPLPVALVLVGALGTLVLLAGTYRLLVVLSGEPRRSAFATAAFATTYAYAYELGVVVRPYALGLGLALLAMASLREALRSGDRRDTVHGTIAGGLAAVASAHSACVAGGAFLAFVLVAVRRPRGVRFGWPVVLALPAFALTLFVALPFPGKTQMANAIHPHPLGAVVKLAAQAFVAGASPVDWWYGAVPPFGGGVGALEGIAATCLFVAVAWALASLVRSLVRLEDAFEPLALVFGWAPLSIVLARHYWGFARHHAFMAVPAIVVAIGWSLAPSTSAWQRSSRLGVRVLAAPWFAVQALLAFYDLRLDARYSFADTKALASALPDAAQLVAEQDWSVAGVLLWRPDLTLRAGNGGGRRFRFIMADNAWNRPAAIEPLVRAACESSLGGGSGGEALHRDAPSNVFFAGTDATSLGRFARCATPMELAGERFGDLPPITERVLLWRVDCTCGARSKPEPSGTPR